MQTVTDGRESRAEWSADLPASGEYAVYVSYKTVERSSEDALYTVRHLGGESRFAVNQTMGGGTWIYLGTFRFAAGQNPALVTLSNRSSKKNRVVTADAVKIGGGMGNVARTPAAEFRTQDTDYFCEPSGYPRFCEGACNGRDFPKRSTARRKGSTTTRRITCRAPTGSTRSWAAPNGCPTKRV